MKRFLACGLLLSLAAPLLAGMTAQTSWTQRWPWETRVDVDVALAGGAKCDLAVTASFRTNGVPVTLDSRGMGALGLPGDLSSPSRFRHQGCALGVQQHHSVQPDH